MAKKQSRLGRAANWNLIVGGVTALVVIGLMAIVGVLINENAIATAVTQNNTTLARSVGNYVLQALQTLTQWLPLASMVVAAAFILIVIRLFSGGGAS